MIEKVPSPLEYFAYMLNFQSLMAGPLVFYRDYIEFIEGYNFIGKSSSNVSMIYIYRHTKILCHIFFYKLNVWLDSISG